MKIIKAKRIKISFHWSLKLSSCFSADVVMKVSKDLKPEARLDGRSGRKKLKPILPKKIAEADENFCFLVGYLWRVL